MRYLPFDFDYSASVSSAIIVAQHPPFARPVAGRRRGRVTPTEQVPFYKLSF